LLESCLIGCGVQIPTILLFVRSGARETRRAVGFESPLFYYWLEAVVFSVLSFQIGLLPSYFTTAQI